MIWPFGSKSSDAKLGKLPFKDGEAFFRNQCEFGETDIQPKRGIVALVLDARSEFGVEDAVKKRPDGIQLALIRVAAPDGGFKTMAETAGSGDDLNVGDVVIWVPLEKMDSFPMAAYDERAAWMGLIVATIAPEIDLASDGFTIIEQYA